MDPHSSKLCFSRVNSIIKFKEIQFISSNASLLGEGQMQAQSKPLDLITQKKSLTSCKNKDCTRASFPTSLIPSTLNPSLKRFSPQHLSCSDEAHTTERASQAWAS